MTELLKEYLDLAKVYIAMLWTSWVSIFIFLVGGVDKLFRTLLILMAIDFITGVIKGFKNKNANSQRAYKGFWKKLVIILIVAGAAQIDLILQEVGVRTIVLMFYVATEFLSILENAAILGIPIPEKLKLSLEQYRDNQNRGDSNEANNKGIHKS